MVRTLRTSGGVQHVRSVWRNSHLRAATITAVDVEIHDCVNDRVRHLAHLPTHLVVTSIGD